MDRACIFVVIECCFLGVVEGDLVGFEGAANPIKFLEEVFLCFDRLDDTGEISDYGEEELDFAAVVEDIAQAVDAEVSQDKNKKEQNEGCKQKQEPKDRGSGRKKVCADRNEGHKHRKQANNKKDTARIAEASHESVVDMPKIRGHDRLSTNKAANDREKDVKQRKGKQEQRSQDHQGSIAFLHIATDNDNGKQKAEQHTSCITEEDLGGGEVVVQKADKTTREGKRKEGDEGVSKPQRDQAVAKGGKEAYNRSQPIHAVDQVDGVDDGDGPHDKSDASQRAKGYIDKIGDAYGGDTKTKSNADQSREELSKKFGARSESDDIVDDADDQDRRCAEKNAKQLPLVEPKCLDDRSVCEEEREQTDGGKSDIDRDPAEEWGGFAMNGSPTRVRDRP